MNKNLKNIAMLTLDLASKKSWNKLLLNEVKKKSQLKIFSDLIKNKRDLLKNLNKYFDHLLFLRSKNIEDSTIKDMLFEILMMRFDLLQDNRKAIKSIFNSFKKNPDGLITLLPSLLDSIILMSEFAKLNSKGIAGQLKIISIFIIYVSTFFIWIKDDSKSLEKTMTALDRYLDQAFNLFKFIK